jgi:hypothetical protein
MYVLRWPQMGSIPMNECCPVHMLARVCYPNQSPPRCVLSKAEYICVVDNSRTLGLLFKCHWFDPQVTRQTHSNLGIVEIRQDSTLAGDDVYIVAQQAPQVYYIPYVCQTKEHLKGWEVVYKVSPHGRLPVPNDEDYNLDPDTYDGEFFQEDGLEGRFEVDLTEPIEIDVDMEMVVDEEDDEVQNENDLVILEGNDTNDKLVTSDGVDYEMVDSDDGSYDPTNPDTYEDYF